MGGSYIGGLGINIDLPKALLLDMDDTILEYGAAEGCWLETCQLAADAIAPVTPEGLVAAIMEHRIWFWGDPERNRTGRLNLEWARRQMVLGAFERLGMSGDSVVNYIADTFSVEREKIVRPFPGALKTLQKLRGSGLPMALITNGAKEPQWEKIRRFGLAQYFDCIIVEGEYGIGKPDPRVYSYALETLGAIPEVAWMAGDHIEFDVGAPQQLGIFGIWVNPSGALPPEAGGVRPDRMIRVLAELVE